VYQIIIEIERKNRMEPKERKQTYHVNLTITSFPTLASTIETKDCELSSGKFHQAARFILTNPAFAVLIVRRRGDI
jgi:hypothetical protein